jgi:hypothetical protein
MTKYIFVYHGGSQPQSEEEGAQVMAAWQNWLNGMGDAVADWGNPVGMSSTVHSDGSVTGDGGANPTSGYSLINAASMEEALTLAKGCPILEAQGSVEVAETMEM